MSRLRAIRSKSGLWLIGIGSILVVFALLVLGLFAARDSRSPDEIRRESEQRANHQRWAEGMRAAELERERTWLAGPMTPCRDFARASGPQLCLEHVGAPSAPLGTPVRYRVRWRGLPAEAYIRIWSINAAPAGERFQYWGAQGAIAPEPLTGPEGDVVLSWDGRGTYCAPADLPMMCDAGEVGRYRLRAAMMTGSDPFWPSWPPRDPVPVRHLAQSETRAFELSGLPQPLTARENFRIHPGRELAREAIAAALPEGALGVDWYVQRRLDRLSPWSVSGRNYCARLDLDSPLTGHVLVCFPRKRHDENGIAVRPGDFTGVSRAWLEPGLIGADAAETKAKAYALEMTGGAATFDHFPGEEEMVEKIHPDPGRYDGSYQGLRDAARDAGLTYVEINQPRPHFREDASGSWWLVDMHLWVQVIDGPRTRDWGRISLRVDHDGHVCRVDPTGEFEGEGPNQREVYSPCRAGTRRLIQPT